MQFNWSRCADLNRRPTPYHGVALPTELQRQIFSIYFLPALSNRLISDSRGLPGIRY